MGRAFWTGEWPVVVRTFSKVTHIMLSYLTFGAIVPSPPWQAINISSTVAHVMSLRVIPGLAINQTVLPIPVV